MQPEVQRLGIDSLKGVSTVARFLDTSEDSVVLMLEEDRLGGILIATLRRMGVKATPNIKNSVESLVQTMSADRADTVSQANGRVDMSSEATTTIMFTDVVGSTAIVERLGDRNARAMLRKHDEIIRRHAKSHGGTEVKSTGDGFMLIFAGARRGVACAVAIQKDLAGGAQDLGDGGLAVRIGLAVGEPRREGENLFGKAVSLAARITAKADGGQVLVSEIVRALIGADGDYTLKKSGEFELKGITGPQVLYEVVWS